MAAVIDVARIEKELKAIQNQRHQAKERLDALRGGRGRGRGPMGMPGRGEPGRGGVFSRLGEAGPRPGSRDAAGPGSRLSVFDRLSGQGARPAADRDADRDPELHRSASAPNGLSSRLSSRLNSAVVVPPGEGDSSKHGDPAAAAENRDRRRSPAREDAAAERAAGRKRLLSAVMVNGQARTVSMDAAAAAEAADVAAERPAKRPVLEADDTTKKRARRMFGSLLVGTLQKFQNEDAAFRASTTAQRRAEQERRAIERAEAEDARLREEAAAARREEREANISALHELSLQADIKGLELQYAKRIQYRQKLLGFCITKTQPPLYWQPKQSSRESEVQLQLAAAVFEDWKQQQLSELEAEKDNLKQQAAAKREAALARLASRQSDGHTGATADEEMEEGVRRHDSEEEGAAGMDEDQQREEGEAEEGQQAEAAINSHGLSGRQQREQEQEQHSGEEDGEEQQQQQSDFEGEAVEEEEEEEVVVEEEEAEERPSRRYRRRHNSDDEEERLLSSDDEDE